MRQEINEISTKMTRVTFHVLLALLIGPLSISECLAAPTKENNTPGLAINSSPTWRDNSPIPIVSVPCSTNGCWEWLPEVTNSDRSLFRRVPNGPGLEEAMPLSSRDTWKETSSIYAPRARALSSLSPSSSSSSSSSFARALSTKPVKKDVFISRSWGPGGLPFSVLYMNPHGSPRASNNRSSSGTSEIVKTKGATGSEHNTRRASFERPPSFLPSSTTATSSPKYPNYRATIRNGSTNGQPKKQYSIIPQLFISYGWGPLGK